MKKSTLLLVGGLAAAAGLFLLSRRPGGVFGSAVPLVPRPVVPVAAPTMGQQLATAGIGAGIAALPAIASGLAGWAGSITSSGAGSDGLDASTLDGMGDDLSGYVV
jgi:hypothetical protein